jgi:hypothetical protein
LKQEDLIPLTFHKNTDGELKTYGTKSSMHLEPDETARTVLNSFDVSCSSAVSVNMCSLRAGEFQCPVLNKVFTEFTHIVAVKTTGNVFCYEVGFRLWLAS